MNESETRKVEVHKNVYAAPFYEMEVWCVYDECADEQEKPESETHADGSMFCSISSLGVGYFQTKEAALDAYREMLANPSGDCTIIAMHLREKVMSCMLDKRSYIKEWSYDSKCCLLDESVLRNFDDEDYFFYGRTAEMIHHKAGDIVQVVDDYGKWRWAIIQEPVPTVEQVSEENKDIAENVTFEVEEGHSFFWWAYDSYLILTGKGEGDWGYGLPQRVFKPLTNVPDYVKKTLTEAYCLNRGKELGTVSLSKI